MWLYLETQRDAGVRLERGDQMPYRSERNPGFLAVGPSLYDESPQAGSYSSENRGTGSYTSRS